MNFYEAIAAALAGLLTLLGALWVTLFVFTPVFEGVWHGCGWAVWVFFVVAILVVLLSGWLEDAKKSAVRKSSKLSPKTLAGGRRPARATPGGVSPKGGAS